MGKADQMPLREVRKIVIEAAEHEPHGIVCPCCGGLANVYRRTIHQDMARFMIKLYHRYTHYPRYYSMRELYPGDNKASSDGSYLVHWELVERTAHLNMSGAPAGMYKLTEKGIRFVNNLEFVPSHVYLLNNKVLKWGDEKINIKMALGKKFNYEELMERGY